MSRVSRGPVSLFTYFPAGTIEPRRASRAVSSEHLATWRAFLIILKMLYRVLFGQKKRPEKKGNNADQLVETCRNSRLCFPEQADFNALSIFSFMLQCYVDSAPFGFLCFPTESLTWPMWSWSRVHHPAILIWTGDPLPLPGHHSADGTYQKVQIQPATGSATSSIEKPPHLHSSILTWALLLL